MNNNVTLRSGLFWNAVNSIGRLGLNFVATIILSRLLTPSDFGTYGILLIFITVSELIADSGMGGYIIKQQNVDDLDYDTLFVYNLVVSIFLYIIIFVLAPYIAEFYNNESLCLGIRICSSVIVIQSMSIIATARLLKGMLFKKMAVISIFSGIIGLLTAVAWGYFWGGYFALIIQLLVSGSLNSFGQMYAVRSVPRLRFDFLRFKKQFRFGINLMGSTMLQSLTTNIVNNIIAKIFNLRIAGIYVQSAKLQSIPTSLVQSILDKTFFPVFSKITFDLSLFNIQATKTSRMTYAICFPLLSLVICLADPLVYVVLGSQWIDCVKTFQILMLASYPMLVKVVNRNLLKALGYTGDILRMELYPFFMLVVGLVISVVIRSYLFLILSIVLCNVMSAIVSFVSVSKRSKISAYSQLANILRFSPVIIIAITSMFFTNGGLAYAIPLVLLLLFVIVYYIIGVPEYVILVEQMIMFIRKRELDD